MSQEIDQRVVEMRFDNAQFEKNSRDTMRTLDKLKEKLKGEDSDAIKAATEELTLQFYKMSEKLYQQQAPQGDPAQAGQQGGAQGDQGGQYYDADYEVVDDDKDKK